MPHRTPVPAPEAIRRLSTVDLARAVREREITSRAAVEAYIARIEAVNPRLNAMPVTRFDEARREADAADARLAEAGFDPPPLWGVPCSIKEAFALTGMPNTAGLVRRKGVVAERDAEAVARLRRAGAIALGVTNVSELCMWMESDNDVYGCTNNPFDVRRTAGGSSGGEGAIVGAEAAPFGLGSDIGGSIRMPAAFNGVFGHKSTGGLVPGTGQYPMAEGPARRYLCTGPLTRFAGDLMPLMRILAGPDGVDDCIDMPLGDPATVDFAKRRVIVVTGDGRHHPTLEVVSAVGRAAGILEARGAKVEVRRFAGLAAAFEMWSELMHRAAETSFLQRMENGGPKVTPLWELAKRAVGRSEFTPMASLLAATEQIAAYVPGLGDTAVRAFETLKAEITAALGADGLILYPPYPRAAPFHGHAYLRQLLLRFEYAYTAVWNVLELPVTAAPVGVDPDGVPLSVQIVAPRGRDHETIAGAQAVEAATGGRPSSGL